ncbi:hypothetical protein GGI23_000242 [Coemansia sp. RSA 2559]|nr:hypothetical protein GGI23_000242 [Coemansia sp. RSA 2559]KAJ2859478.1 hypothetical protein GGI22_002976 [Coemansia erecta]
MPRPVRRKPAEKEKENIKVQKEEPIVETGLLTPIRTSTPRYGRRLSANHRRLSLTPVSPPSLGGKRETDELGQVLSFDGLIAGMSPIKKGDAPYDELATPPPLPPLADDEESRRSSGGEDEEDFDLDAFVATKYRRTTAPHKSFVDRLGGAETGDALPKRNKTRRDTASPTGSAAKKKRKKATAEMKHNATPTTKKRKR